MADEQCLSLYFRPEDVALILGKMAPLRTCRVHIVVPETSKADGVPFKDMFKFFLNNSSHPALMAAICFFPPNFSLHFSLIACLFFFFGGGQLQDDSLQAKKSIRQKQKQ